MNDTVGIILTEESEVKLNELTERRAVAAVPIGCRYRLIDFILSNMVNSGIINVGVTTQYNYSSLMDHLGNGAPWDLSRKRYGLYMLPPYVSREKFSVGMGNIGVLNGISTYLRKSSQKYVLISEGHTIFNMDFNPVLEYHIAKGADVTIIYNKLQNDLNRYTVLEADESGRVVSLEFGPREPKSNCASMGMFVMEKELLQSIVAECMSRGESDLVINGFIKNLNKLRIYGYEFGGYVGRVDSVKAYYDISMDLLNKDIRDELFGGVDRIYTNVSDQVPTKHNRDACVRNSLIADGCIIDGHVENSLIFRGAKIGVGTVIKNSIIMQNSVVYAGCDLENIVLDKDVSITENKRLVGQPNYPIIISKGTVV